MQKLKNYIFQKDSLAKNSIFLKQNIENTSLQKLFYIINSLEIFDKKKNIIKPKLLTTYNFDISIKPIDLSQYFNRIFCKLPQKTTDNIISNCSPLKKLLPPGIYWYILYMYYSTLLISPVLFCFCFMHKEGDDMSLDEIWDYILGLLKALFGSIKNSILFIFGLIKKILKKIKENLENKETQTRLCMAAVSLLGLYLAFPVCILTEQIFFYIIYRIIGFSLMPWPELYKEFEPIDGPIEFLQHNLYWLLYLGI